MTVGASRQPLRPLGSKRSRTVRAAAARRDRGTRISGIFVSGATPKPFACSRLWSEPLPVAEATWLDLHRGRAEPAFYLFRILFVERVSEFAQRMAHHDAKFFPVQIRNASLKIRPVQVKGPRQIPLRAKDRIAHESH